MWGDMARHLIKSFRSLWTCYTNNRRNQRFPTRNRFQTGDVFLARSCRHILSQVRKNERRRFVIFCGDFHPGHCVGQVGSKGGGFLPVKRNLDEPALLDYARPFSKNFVPITSPPRSTNRPTRSTVRSQRAEQMKVHTMFVIGKRDMEANAVSLRIHGKGNLGARQRAIKRSLRFC